jgi:poly-gamma-glutamate synthesis protein (capsule biosynthesis protein)
VPRLQGIEFHQGSPIFYGLGNFIFQTEKVVGAYGPESWEGVIVDCTFENGRFTQARLVPLRMNEIGQDGPEDMATRGFPNLADGSEITATLGVIAAASRVLGNSARISPDGILTAQ